MPRCPFRGGCNLNTGFNFGMSESFASPSQTFFAKSGIGAAHLDTCTTLPAYFRIVGAFLRSLWMAPLRSDQMQSLCVLIYLNCAQSQPDMEARPVLHPGFPCTSYTHPPSLRSMAGMTSDIVIIWRCAVV